MMRVVHVTPRPEPAKLRVEIKQLCEHDVASVRTTTQPSRLRHTVGLIHELVMDAVGQQGLAPAGLR